MRRIQWRWLSLAWAALVVVSPCRAATYHVSPNGSNTPPYNSYATAAQKVADAANLALNPGDTVLVHAGSYSSTDTIRIALGVTFAGVGRDSVTIDWGDNEFRPGRMCSLAGGNEVYGITLRYPLGTSFNSSVTAIHAFAGQQVWLHDCRVVEAHTDLDGDTKFVIEGNEFDYGFSIGVFVGGRNCQVRGNLFIVSPPSHGYIAIWAWLADTVIIESNRFFACPSTNDNPFGIEIRDCDTAVIRNNLLVNSYYAVLWQETDGLIENNTMIHTDPDWPYSVAVFQGAADNLTIRNNTFVDMARPILWGPQAGVGTAGLTTFIHNTFWPPRDTLYAMYPAGTDPSRFPLVDSANVFAYPMFADDSLYCPQVGSPLIDSGDPALLDVDGTRSDIGWHGGPGGFLCSHPERPPLSPDSLWVGGTDGIAELTWSSRPEADLAEYRLYRGTMPGFWTPGNPPHRIYGPADTSAQDTLLSTGGVYYYVVTAVDTAGLESDASPEGMFVETGVFEPADPQSPVPREPGVISAYPNPFNVGVALVINLLGGDSRAEAAAIEITDVLGRLVRRLAVPRESPGQATVVWDGRTEYGRVAASGVYFARLTAAGGQLGGVHKLVLVR